VFDPIGILRGVGRMRTGTLSDIIMNNKIYDFLYIDPGVSSVPIECLRSVKALKWLYEKGFFDRAIERKHNDDFDYRNFIDNYVYRFDSVNVHAIEPHGIVLPIKREDDDFYYGEDLPPHSTDGSGEHDVSEDYTEPVVRYAI
jgi:hypothetical protein